jgi:hypothetical protein
MEKATNISVGSLYLCRQLEAIRRRERAFFAKELVWQRKRLPTFLLVAFIYAGNDRILS